MEDPTLREALPPDPLDADLVCELCSTVNAPGTLYCHKCGNNLREQRHKRLAGGEVLLEESDHRSRYVVGALSAVGLVVVVLMAWNVNTIAEWMVGGPPRIDTNIYWQGPLAPDFEDMGREIRANPLSAEERQAAYANPASAPTPEGRYVVRLVVSVVERTLGEVLVRDRNGVLLFVALLDSGAEVRGTARIEEGGRLSSSSVTHMLDGRTIGGVGFAVQNAAGGYTATGISDLDDRPFELRMYRVP